MAGLEDHRAHRDHRNVRARHFLRPLLLALPLLAALGGVGDACATGKWAKEKTSAPAASAGSVVPARPVMVYHDSWYERPAAGAAATTLASIPGYVNVVALSFVRPDAVYPGRLDISGTGLQYQFNGQILKDAIALLKKRQPGIRVILSVGGSGYKRWSELNINAIAQLVRDLGADGVDIDYEPVAPGCRLTKQERIECSGDAVWRDLVARFRQALPRPMLLSVPAWSVGAYGEGVYRDALPRSSWTGSMLGLLRSPQAASIDLISIMSYDAGPSFDPWQSYQSYRAVWSGPLALGVQTPPSFADGPNYTVSMAEKFARQVASDPYGGMMLYPLLGRPSGTLSPDNPDGRMLLQALCRGMGLDGCDKTVP